MEEQSKDANQADQKECRTVLLEDEPSKTDAFGPHQDIANTVAKLVKTEKGGKAIALIGSLGSGKSTVVELMKSNLSNDDKAFIFNAWSHQGDPLRRSFLENLIEFLLGEKWLVDTKKWERELYKIKRRLEKTKSTSEPVLTTAGTLMAIYLLLLPIGYALLSNEKFLEIFPAWVIVFIITSIPVLILLISLTPESLNQGFLVNVTTNEPSENNKEKSNKRKNIVGIFIQKTREEIKSNTIRTPDPTSIEFQDIFNRILDESIGKSERRLVIVIDNLDRADPQDALTIWSTMRTFFELDNKKPPTWIERYWLLVPFDPSALNRLWKSEAEEGSNKDADLHSAFIDKTFQIKFPVPPPILSDWKEFFNHEIERAFQDHLEQDFLDIYHLYRLLKIKNNPPTPREIKLFINQIGAFHRIWGDEIPIQYQALYVIYKKELQSSKEAFLKPDTDDNLKHIYRIVGTDFAQYLAALHFNVDPKKALQILIGDTILEALEKGSKEDLKKVALTPGFLDVCENIIEDYSGYWTEKDPETIATAALAFNGIEKETKLNLSRIWNKLSTATEKVDSLNSVNEEVGDGLVAILKHTPEAKYDELAKHILKILSNTEPTDIAPSDSKKEEPLDQKMAHEWKNGTISVISELHETGNDEIIMNYFKVPGDANFYIDLMIELSKDERKDKYVKYFVPQVEVNQIVTELTRICGEGKFKEDHAICIDLLMKVPGGWSWKDFIAILKQRLEGEIVLEPTEIIGCVQSLIIYAYGSGTPQAIEALKGLCTNGYLLHHLHHGNNKNNDKARALCVFPLLEYNPEGKPTPQVGQSNEGLNVYISILKNPESHPGVIKNLSDLFLEFDDVENLINLLSSDSPTTDILITILENILQRVDAIEHITPTIFIDHYKDLKETIDDNIFDEFLKKLISDANLINELTQRPFSHELAHLYRVVYDNSKEQLYIEYLKKEFKTIDSTIWGKELNSEGDLIQLLLSLVDNGQRLELATDYSDALLLHADQINSGKAKITLAMNNSTNILSPLIEASRQTFLHKLCKKIISLSNNPTERIIDFYGNELINSGVLKEESDDVVITLFSNIVSRKNIRELEWVEYAIGKQPEIFSNCRNDSKVDFIKRLENTLDKTETNDEARPVIEKIAKTLGIDPSNHQPKNESEGEEEEEEEESKPETE